VEELRKAVAALDPDLAEAACQAVLQEGIDPQVALTEGAIQGLQEVGELYENETYALPELMFSIAVMDSVRAVLEPEILKMNRSVERKGTILVGTVQHDIHDIGKKIVSAMLRSVGWEVVDIGNNVSPQLFLEKAKEIQPDVLGMSALLTTTIPYAGTTVQVLRDAGVLVPVIFGGAPVTKNYTDSIGAAYAENAGEACQVCAGLLEEKAI
jgi:methylmalonyl-CoA mutase cobalamin-binding domain/chain